MNRRVAARLSIILLLVLFGVGGSVDVARAQEIAGTLVFEEPFEEDTTPQWTDKYIAGAGAATNLGPVEDGPEGGLAEVIIIDDPGSGMNDVQFSFVFAAPEDSDLYQWRITCYVWVDIAPFMIRPIIAMSEDPWSGVSLDTEIPEEFSENWYFLDATLEAGDFLTTPDLIVIFHMGANEAYEVRFDDLKVYLLDQETDVDTWMMH